MQEDSRLELVRPERRSACRKMPGWSWLGQRGGAHAGRCQARVGEAREEERMQEDARLELVRPERRSACRKMSGWS